MRAAGWFFAGLVHAATLAGVGAWVANNREGPGSERVTVFDESTLLDPRADMTTTLGPPLKKNAPKAVALSGRKLLLLGDRFEPAVYFDGHQFSKAGWPKEDTGGNAIALKGEGDTAFVAIDSAVWRWSSPGTWDALAPMPMKPSTWVRLTDGRLLASAQDGQTFLSDEAVTTWSPAQSCGRGAWWALPNEAAMQFDVDAPTVFRWSAGHCVHVLAFEEMLSKHLDRYAGALAVGTGTDVFVFGNFSTALKWSSSEGEAQQKAYVELPEPQNADVLAIGPDSVLFVTPAGLTVFTPSTETFRELHSLGLRNSHSVLALGDGTVAILGGSHDDYETKLDSWGLVTAIALLAGLGSLAFAAVKVPDGRPRKAYIIGLLSTGVLASALGVLVLLVASSVRIS